MACGCGSRPKHLQGAAPSTQSISMPDLVRVAITEALSPVYGAISGTMYPFHEKHVLFVDKRDLAALDVEYEVVP